MSIYSSRYKSKKTSEIIGDLVGHFLAWLLNAFLIMWFWNEAWSYVFEFRDITYW